MLFTGINASTREFSSGAIQAGKIILPAHKSLCIAFYNVENLFDTINDPSTEDEEFTPEGKQHWTAFKYEWKICNIARVIRAMNDGKGADIVGLAEVENKKVLQDLITEPHLRKLNYGIVHHESPDKRGIDVAMIYKKGALKVVGQKSFSVDISQFDDRPTRDILLVQGIEGKNDTLSILLNHWPSRREGKEASAPKRIAAAAVVRKIVDTLMMQNPGARILVIGDFNDNPTDKSLSEVLGATRIPDTSHINSIYNCGFNFNWKNGEGSEFYKGEWSRLIQIIVSTALIKNQINSDGTFTDVHIFKPDWILREDEVSHQLIPFRTFERDNDAIGFSDHLPVYIMLRTNF